MVRTPGIAHRLLYGGWLAAAGRQYQALTAALRDPEAAQQELLRRILRENRESRMGQRLHFSQIDSPQAFRRRVPLVRYDDLAGDIEAIRRGEAQVLTREPVRRLVPTGGSTGARKLIPFTSSLGGSFARGVGAWMVDLTRRYPQIRSGPAYWSVSPAMDLPEAPSAVPIGFDNDAAYLGRWLEPLVARTLLAPPALRHARPISSFQYATLRLLLEARELRLLSVWHPSFLELLLEARGEAWERLLDDLRGGTLTPPEPLEPRIRAALSRGLRPNPGRARELDQMGPEASPRQLWPRLAVVSTWGDGAAQGPFDRLRRRLGTVAIQPKGLLATEAFVSLPFAGRHPFALHSAYFELLDDSGKAHGVDEAVDGETYEVVVTTAGGLYRYRLGDRVILEGRVAATPSLRLTGRTDQVVDRVGEKLSEAFVSHALRRAFGGEDLPPFAMLAPDGDRYVLYLDRPPSDRRALTGQLTDALRENPAFAYAQDLGQLGPLEILLAAPDAHRRFLAHRECQGQSLGEIKPTYLSDEGPWREILGASEAGTPTSRDSGALPINS